MCARIQKERELSCLNHLWDKLGSTAGREVCSVDGGYVTPVGVVSLMNITILHASGVPGRCPKRPGDLESIREPLYVQLALSGPTSVLLLVHITILSSPAHTYADNHAPNLQPHTPNSQFPIVAAGAASFGRRAFCLPHEVKASKALEAACGFRRGNIQSHRYEEMETRGVQTRSANVESSKLAPESTVIHRSAWVFKMHPYRLSLKPLILEYT